MTKQADDLEPIIARRTIIEGIFGIGMLVLAFSAIAASDISGGTYKVTGPPCW